MHLCVVRFCFSFQCVLFFTKSRSVFSHGCCGLSFAPQPLRVSVLLFYVLSLLCTVYGVCMASLLPVGSLSMASVTPLMGRYLDRFYVLRLCSLLCLLSLSFRVFRALHGPLWLMFSFCFFDLLAGAGFCLF